MRLLDYDLKRFIFIDTFSNWLCAFAQLVPGPKFQLTIGFAPALDKELPVIKLETFNIPFLSHEDPEWWLGLDPLPLLIDSGDDLAFARRCCCGEC